MPMVPFDESGSDATSAFEGWRLEEAQVPQGNPGDILQWNVELGDWAAIDPIDAVGIDPAIDNTDLSYGTTLNQDSSDWRYRTTPDQGDFLRFIVEEQGQEPIWEIDLPNGGADGTGVHFQLTYTQRTTNRNYSRLQFQQSYENYVAGAPTYGKNPGDLESSLSWVKCYGDFGHDGWKANHVFQADDTGLVFLKVAAVDVGVAGNNITVANAIGGSVSDGTVQITYNDTLDQIGILWPTDIPSVTLDTVITAASNYDPASDGLNANNVPLPVVFSAQISWQAESGVDTTFMDGMVWMGDTLNLGAWAGYAGVDPVVGAGLPIQAILDFCNAHSDEFHNWQYDEDGPSWGDEDKEGWSGYGNWKFRTTTPDAILTKQDLKDAGIFQAQYSSYFLAQPIEDNPYQVGSTGSSGGARSYSYPSTKGDVNKGSWIPANFVLAGSADVAISGAGMTDGATLVWDSRATNNKLKKPGAWVVTTPNGTDYTVHNQLRVWSKSRSVMALTEAGDEYQGVNFDEVNNWQQTIRLDHELVEYDHLSFSDLDIDYHHVDKIVLDENFLGEDSSQPENSYPGAGAFIRTGSFTLVIESKTKGRSLKVTNNAKLLDPVTGLKEEGEPRTCFVKIGRVLTDDLQPQGGTIMGFDQWELSAGETAEFICIEASTLVAGEDGAIWSPSRWIIV